MNNGLYVHIPFCGAICHYCDFTKFIYQKNWVKPYLKELAHDLALFNVPLSQHTIYVGGGTPTVLRFHELKALLKMLQPYTKEVVEYTFEGNIESITLPKLQLLKEYGVNRLSIGVQSTNNERLKELNRQHSYRAIRQKIELVKKMGFHNYSVDLIYGLPHQSQDELATDIANILKLEPPHISTYDLQIETNTVAFIKKWPKISDEESRVMYEDVLNTLRSKGFERYEVSNFARPGFESVHNKRYWRNEPYYAIGLGASGYIDHKRYKIGGGLTRYLKGERKLEEEAITPAMYIEEFFMLGLRMKEGISLTDFKIRTGLDLLATYKNQIDLLKARGLVTYNDTHFFCTDEGILLLDSVIVTLIS